MAVVPDAGEPLSPQAADLVRRIARAVLDEPADLMAEVYAAVSAAADEPLRSEPVLAAEVAASTRANVLHWAAGIARDPGGRVPANLSPEVLGIAREAFRRGIEQTVYTTYHAGQNVVWAAGVGPDNGGGVLAAQVVAQLGAGARGGDGGAFQDEAHHLEPAYVAAAGQFRPLASELLGQRRHHVIDEVGQRP